MWIGQKTIIRILRNAFLPLGISLLYIEPGGAENIAENISKKTFNGNTFGFITTAGTQ